MLKKKTYKRGKRNTSAISKLSKKVDSIAKLARAGVQTIYTQADGVAAISRPMTYMNLCDFSTFDPVFGSDPVDYQSVNKWTLKSQTIDMSLNASNEMANIEMSIYLVTLKDDSNRVYNKETGVLTLVEGLDYSMSGANFIQTILNPKVFNVKWKKHLLIGNNNSSLVNSTAVGPRAYKRFHKRFIVNTQYRNIYGNVYALKASQDPSKQRFLLIFNDNQTGDLENPVLVINMVNEIQVST